MSTLRKIYLESIQDDKFNTSTTKLLKQIDITLKSLRQITDFAIADIIQKGLKNSIDEVKRTQQQTKIQKLLSKNIQYDSQQVQNLLKTLLIIKKAYNAFTTTFKKEFSKLEELSKLQPNDENVSLQTIFETNKIDKKILDTLSNKILNTFTKEIERSSYFDIRTLTKEDIQSATILDIENVNEILNEIDLSQFNEMFAKVSKNIETSTKQKIDQKTNITEKDLGAAARKVALLWQSTKDPNAFVSILISAGLDVEKLNKINIR